MLAASLGIPYPTPTLSFVLPCDMSIQDVLELVLDAAKADTDLWVNVWFLSIFAFLDAIISRLTLHLPAGATSYSLLGRLGAMTFSPDLEMWLICVAAITSAFLAAWFARKATIEWGSLVKASVDLYLPSLYKALHFKDTSETKDVKAEWERFSQAIMDRRPDRMPDRMWGRTQKADIAGLDGLGI
jgi:hypothetical protein